MLTKFFLALAIFFGTLAQRLCNHSKQKRKQTMGIHSFACITCGKEGRTQL